MQKRLNQFMVLFVIVAVIMTSVVRTTPVYADDGGTQPADDGSTQPVDDGSTSTDEGQTAVATEDQSTSAPTEEPAAVVEESTPVAEILDQLPADTDLVVVNDAGDVEPLATTVAAEIIATGDPVWCPTTPGAGGCTGSFSDFASLIAVLETDAASATPLYTGNGTIWVQDTYAGNDNTQIIFNGATLPTLHNLTIQGGWDGGASGSHSGTSSADVSMVFTNWNGDITINDFDIAAADGAGFGLYVNNTGATALNNVSVNSTTGSGDGAVVNSTGNVSITNSDFNNNTANGLQVKSGGTINLNTVSASNNTLTGAYLDSCLYENVTPGLCAGSGLITITSATSNLFNGNHFNGLVVDAGGGIAIDNTQANSNSLNGAVLTSADDNGTGNVTVDQSAFSTNANGTGLDIFTDGSIGLTNVNAFSNFTGTVLDTTNGIGGISVSGSNFGNTGLGNTGTGLHAESGSTVDLTNVVASDNGTNGAYLTAEGNITISGNSIFSDNVHFNFPQDPGLYAKSNGGNITLTNVIADGNDYGAGGVLITSNSGIIGVTGGHFNDNGTFGVQTQGQNGDITLNGITASYNEVKGAYLASYGTGDISVINNSIFVENGSYGIYASASQGNIILSNAHVTGDDSVGTGDNLTDYGAVLVTNDGGSIFVSNSSFNLNTEVGLKIIASGPVNLTNVTADHNGVNGVEVYSTYTASPVCPGAEVVNVTVNVDGGTFSNSGQYGLMVKPGPGGAVNFVNAPTYSGNGVGDFLLDLSEPAQSTDCGGHDEPSDSKEPNKVQVPPSGGTPVEQNCDLFSSTILELPNGTWANVGCPFKGFSNLEELLKDNLPGKLGAGTNFIAGVTVSLTDAEGNTTLNEDGTITVSFKLPKDLRGRGYSILFWDPTLNNGQGGWVEMPLFEAGTSFPLNPNDPADQRTVISGVQQNGDTVTFTVNFPGIFVLASR